MSQAIVVNTCISVHFKTCRIPSIKPTAIFACMCVVLVTIRVVKLSKASNGQPGMVTIHYGLVKVKVYNKYFFRELSSTRSAIDCAVACLRGYVRLVFLYEGVGPYCRCYVVGYREVRDVKTCAASGDIQDRNITSTERIMLTKAMVGRPKDSYIFQQEVDMTSILNMNKRQRRRTRIGILNHADYVIIYANVGRVFKLLSLSLARNGTYVLEKAFELKHKVSVVCSYGEELALRSKGRWDVYQLLDATGGPVIPMNPPCPREYECTALKLMKLLKYGSFTVLAQIQIYEGSNYKKDLVVRYDEGRTSSSGAVNITLGNVRKIAEDNKRRLALFSADREGNVVILLTGRTGRPIRVCYHRQNRSYARHCLPVRYPGLVLRATPKSASRDEVNTRFVLTVLSGRKMLLLISVDLSCFESKKSFIKPDIEAPSTIKRDLMFLGHGFWGDVVQVKKRGARVVTVYRPVLAFR